MALHNRLLALTSTLFPAARNAPALVVRFALITLVVTSLSRIALSLGDMDRISSLNHWLELILQGLRIDIVLLCYVYSIPLLLSIFLFNDRLSRSFYGVLKLWLVLALRGINPRKNRQICRLRAR